MERTLKRLHNFVDFIGQSALHSVKFCGQIALFLRDTSTTFLTTKIKVRKMFYQMLHVGVNSWSVVILTGACVGGVLAYQSYKGLSRFQGEKFIGPIVFIAMAREFGPVLSSIMVTARAGSAMTAEIGSMRITEQIDALKTLLINPYQYLIVPRLLATTIIMPFLSLFCTLSGIVAGYIVSVYKLGINAEMYMKTIQENVILSDITTGLVKAVVFGFLLSWIASYKGYTTYGGARGVGISTTQSVVIACVAIFVADYILTALML